MIDRYTEPIRRAIVEGRDLNNTEGAHLASCPVCRGAADQASAFSTELDAALVRRRLGPLPADPLIASVSSPRPPLAAAAIAGMLLLAALTAGALGARFTATPASSVHPTATVSPLESRPPVEERIRGFEELLRLHNVNPEAVVRLSDDYAVAAIAGEARVRVMEFYFLPTGEPHARELAGGEHDGTVPSFMLQTSSGETDVEWNTIFYGTAPSNASQVVLEGRHAEGGYVVGRAWVLMIREKGLEPNALHWRFLDAHGNTLLRGTGLGPVQAATPTPHPAPTPTDPVVENPWPKAAVELPSENTSQMRAVVSGDAGFVAVGGGGSVEGLGGMLAWYSADGEEWTLVVDRHADRNGSSFSDVVAIDGGYVAVGTNPSGSAVWLSADGRSWRPATGPSPGGHDDAVLAAGSNGEAIFAVGFTSENDEQVAVVWRSVDGDSWTRLEVPDSFAHAWPTDIAVGPDGSAMVVGMSEPGGGSPLSWAVDDTSVGDTVPLPASAGDVLTASVVITPREIAVVGHTWDDRVQAYRLVLWTSTDGRGWVEQRSTTVGLPGDAAYIAGRGLVVSGATYHLDWSEVAVWEHHGAESWRETLIEDSAGVGDGVVEGANGRLIVVGASDPDGAATVWLEPRIGEP